MVYLTPRHDSGGNRLNFADRISEYRLRIDAALDRWLPNPEAKPSKLHEALRYSVLGGGKRVRPLLVYATGEALDLDPVQLDPIAVAVEMIHAYSLVHDDLPAMDDDKLRRGRATTHIAFDEATAILVGDALQSLSYYVLAADPAYDSMPQTRGCLIRCLAEAIGSTGMAGGQLMDLEAEGAELEPADLEDLYSRKTGRLIQASIMMPCYCRFDTTEPEFDRLDQFARMVGLAFQVKDDVLDVEGSTDVIGKPQGSDMKNGKATYPSIAGLEGAKAHAEDLYNDAMSQLEHVPNDTESLRWLSAYIVKRNN